MGIPRQTQIFLCKIGIEGVYMYITRTYFRDELQRNHLKKVNLKVADNGLAEPSKAESVGEQSDCDL